MKRLWGSALLALAACSSAGIVGNTSGGNTGNSISGVEAPSGATIPLTITSANGAHVFIVELAKTAAAQEKGLMYRTGLKPDFGMLFWPYPPEGGPPRAANFWMKNTPSALDILFLRTDHSIAHIAENAVPFSEAMIPSGEPAAAVLEIPGGRAAELGISEGDKVSWPGDK